MTTYVGPATVLPLDTAAMTSADLQVICQRIHNSIISTGIVDTGDTGATDLSTITVGSVNTDRGWRMYRFNDASQGTYPVYFKVWYGMGNVSSRFRLKIQVGQGTDGAGTLTGYLTATPVVGGSLAQNTQTQASSEYSCHVDGFFGIQVAIGHDGSDGYAMASFVIERTRDPITGAFDGDGVVTWSCSPNPASTGEVCVADIVGAGAQSYAYDLYNHVLAVGSPTNTADEAGDKRIYPVWFELYGIRQMWSIAQFRLSETGNTPGTLTASPFAPLGARTMAMTGSWAPVLSCTSDTNYRLMMIFE